MVSIIVPVHNAREYLVRCLESIRRQTYDNIEVILVNDGSEDDSLKICMYYQVIDTRFRIIDKPQTGVSDTRNQGIEAAAGKYLQFVDSDDWIAEDATFTMVDAAQKAECDMVITHFYRVVGKRISHQGHIRNEEVMGRQQFAGYMMHAPANFYYGVMWNKLFRRDIVQNNGIRCMAGLNWCEDFIFNLEYLQYAQRIYAVPNPTYYYVKTKNSLISTEVTLKQTIKVKLLIFDYYKELYKSVEMYDDNKRRVQKFLISVAKDGGIFPYKHSSRQDERKVYGKGFGNRQDKECGLKPGV